MDEKIKVAVYLDGEAARKFQEELIRRSTLAGVDITAGALGRVLIEQQLKAAQKTSGENPKSS